MKITPTSNILIAGQHSPRGVPVDAPDRIALELIAQGLATRTHGAKPSAPVAETAANLPASVETADLPPQVAEPSARRRKRQ